MENDINKDPFEEYFRDEYVGRREAAYMWSTAIGLQAVDNLEPSEYLVDLARRNIEGDVNLADVEPLLETYYKQKPEDAERTRESDVVSGRIVEILSEKAFTFSPAEYIGIHGRLFAGIYKHAGKIRDYNISKKEWVLNGASVHYGSAANLRETLEYDFRQEREYSYRGRSMDEVITHLATFVSNLWQIHIFGEGNTRTTAVFLIKYLRQLGFDVTNDVFAQNAWYFRNSLVRANYSNVKDGVYPTTEYLEKLLRNLLLGENNVLSNRAMHISGKFESKKVNIGSGKENIEVKKVNIEDKKANIDISKIPGISSITATQILKVYSEFGTDGIFGRSDCERITGVKATRAYKLVKFMFEKGLTEPVTGHGKGKYKFKNTLG